MMKRYLMATAVLALSVASAAQAQEEGRRGMGMRPGQGVREQTQQAQPQPQPETRRDRGDRGDRGMGYRPGQTVQPQPEAQPQSAPERDGRRRWEGPDRDGDRPRLRDGRDGRDGRPDMRGDTPRRDEAGQGRRVDRAWRGGDRHDYRHWRGDDRRSRVWPSQQRFRIGVYRAPYGYSYRRWSFGEHLPRAYYVQQYVIGDFWSYDLPEPPWGTVWVRYGSDALLVDARSGYVEDVIYGIFW